MIESVERTPSPADAGMPCAAAGSESAGWSPGRESLPLMEQLSEVACVVRDASLAVRWCNDAYVRLGRTPKEELIGSGLEDVMPAKAASERGAMMRRVIETRRSIKFYQCAADQRLSCTFMPIDAESFGFEGVMGVLQPASGIDEAPTDLPVVETPCLRVLGVLSPAELRVLLHLGKGRTTAEIGEHLSRSAKTVEKQIESVHRKLGTKSRAELVRLTVERGLQAFSDDDWERIIQGSKAVKRS